VTFELNADSTPSYLADRGLAASRDLTCRELGGGVSNTVILVDNPPGERFVLKQALPQLRVEKEWLADRSRIFRERDALEVAAELLPSSWVPEILWSDDDNFVYAMQAFSLEAQSWKERLLSGDLNPVFARRVGVALGLTIRNSWRSRDLQERFGDRTAFEQLRGDPYYGEIARRHPSIAQAVADWRGRDVQVGLVHGDWSPKNILVDDDRLIFIDYECAHFGDPTFDSAFVLNHLILKGAHLPAQRDDFLRLARVAFTWTLSVLPREALASFEADTMRHLAFLMLARIDGKSPLEYLTQESVRDQVRQTALRLIARRPATLDDALAML